MANMRNLQQNGVLACPNQLEETYSKSLDREV